MSSINAVGLFPLIPSAPARQPSSAELLAEGVGATYSDGTTALGIGPSAQPVEVQGVESHGFARIATAVAGALQAAQSVGAGVIDPNQVIQDTVSQVLSTDPSALYGSDGVQATAPASADGGAGSDSSAGSESRAAQSALIQTLEDFGVTPQAFRQDVLNAVQNVNEIHPGTSSVSQAAPPGSVVNATA